MISMHLLTFSIQFGIQVTFLIDIKAFLQLPPSPLSLSIILKKKTEII